MLKTISDTLTGIAAIILVSIVAAAAAFGLVGVAARAWHWMLAGF